MTAPDKIVFVRCCAFCGGKMDGSVPECMVSVVPRHPPEWRTWVIPSVSGVL
jgi:hypothetical protein